MPIVVDWKRRETVDRVKALKLSPGSPPIKMNISNATTYSRKHVLIKIEVKFEKLFLKKTHKLHIKIDFFNKNKPLALLLTTAHRRASSSRTEFHWNLFNENRTLVSRDPSLNQPAWYTFDRGRGNNSWTEFWNEGKKNVVAKSRTGSKKRSWSTFRICNREGERRRGRVSGWRATIRILETDTEIYSGRTRLSMEIHSLFLHSSSRTPWIHHALNFSSFSIENTWKHSVLERDSWEEIWARKYKGLASLGRTTRVWPNFSWKSTSQRQES